jgi:hypothetical protein
MPIEHFRTVDVWCATDVRANRVIDEPSGDEANINRL